SRSANMDSLPRTLRNGPSPPRARTTPRGFAGRIIEEARRPDKRSEREPAALSRIASRAQDVTHVKPEAASSGRSLADGVGLQFVDSDGLGFVERVLHLGKAKDAFDGDRSHSVIRDLARVHP